MSHKAPCFKHELLETEKSILQIKVIKNQSYAFNNTDGDEKMSEKLPISDFYKVVDHVTIFKSEKWWEAIVLIESFGRRSIAMYMWWFKDGKWKRKHKFQLRNIDEWNKVKNAVDKLFPKLHG